MTDKKTTLLCILDGFGINPNQYGNAVVQAKKPVIDRLLSECPNTSLKTDGEEVGLPAGQMGNSEVGHLNIGAGRVVEQWLLRISRALQGAFLDSSEPYLTFKHSLTNATALHLIGLFSDGGVHSHCEHFYLLLERVYRDYAGEIFIHIITDGRDTSPNQAQDKVAELCDRLKNYPRCKIASISGRFYTMDRDKRWERTSKAAQAIGSAEAAKIDDVIAYIKNSYHNNITDEFIEPAVFAGRPIQSNDNVIFWNFREDRMRQIVNALCLENFDGFHRNFQHFNNSRVLCFTEYDHSFHLPYLFEILDIRNHLGEWLASNGLTQLRVAETEKYPHVTYFFNGGIEKEYPGEERKVLPSPRDVKTYDEKPEMSAAAVCETVIHGIESGKYDLIVVNFANCDMVGHTGVLSAAIKAVETVDNCLGQILTVLEKKGGQALIIADHGNAEKMMNEDGTPFTSHTTFLVPAILFNYQKPVQMRSGALCDVAPTILKMMSISQPKEMSGTSLLQA